MIEVIERHEYHEPKYLTRCARCQSILRFQETDVVLEEHGYQDNDYLLCPVCGFTNALGLKSDWVIETERLKGELDGN